MRWQVWSQRVSLQATGQDDLAFVHRRHLQIILEL